MSLKETIQNEPVRFASALLAFGVAFSALLALVTTAAVAAAVGGVWVAGVGIFNALFTRSQVTPNAHVPDIVHDTIVALAPYAPKVVDTVVHVAESKLLPPPQLPTP